MEESLESTAQVIPEGADGSTRDFAEVLERKAKAKL